MRWGSLSDLGGVLRVGGVMAEKARHDVMCVEGAGGGWNGRKGRKHLSNEGFEAERNTTNAPKQESS